MKYMKAKTMLNIHRELETLLTWNGIGGHVQVTTVRHYSENGVVVFEKQQHVGFFLKERQCLV